VKYKEYYGVEEKPKKKIKKPEQKNIVLEDIKKEIREFQEDFGMSAKQLPSFSSKEARKVVDDGLRVWAKELRKVEHKVIKDWMSKAKSGVIDYFDIVRGLQTGDATRAHPEETTFLKALLDRNKIMNRFRSYFGGKKGKPRR